MRLLIIEDELKIASYLQKGLSENNYIVDLAADGEDGLHLATEFPYDLIILDLMMPKRDGWSVLKQLRTQGQTVLILILSARNAIEERVKGLEFGADDYLVKPFSFSELLARVRTLLRRGKINSPEILTIADLHMDLVRHKVSRGQELLNLTPKEFSLLSLLMRRTGEVISRTVITEQIWDMDFDHDTNVVDVVVRRLRQKIDDSFEPKLIHTIRGVGYVLEQRETEHL